MGIRTGGDLASTPAYGIYRSAAKYGKEMLAKAAAAIALSRAIVLPVMRVRDNVGLRIFSVGVVEEKEKLRGHSRLDNQWGRGRADE